ncbi:MULTISPECIES: hypothetical protein [unclassified Nocardia]|uniref:hypothetical protein n=1 Tax=unclassified Nocardia TaxID=2637762 RepID=UPI0035DFD57E
MTRILTKASAATALFAGLIAAGSGLANAEAPILQPAPIAADSGSSQASVVQTGSGTGSAAIDLPTAMLLCRLTGGTYNLGLGSSMMNHGPSGCFNGLFGKTPIG